MTHKMTEKEYEWHIQRLDGVYQQYNPCQFDGDWNCRAARLMLARLEGHNSCCKTCEYVTCTGCSTRNVLCKTFFCNEAIKSLPPEVKTEILARQERIMLALRFWIARFSYYKDEIHIKEKLGLALNP